MKSVNNVKKKKERDSECNTSKCPKEVLAQIVCTAAEYVVYPRMYILYAHSVAGIYGCECIRVWHAWPITLCQYYECFMARTTPFFFLPFFFILVYCISASILYVYCIVHQRSGRCTCTNFMYYTFSHIHQRRYIGIPNAVHALVIFAINRIYSRK